MAGHPIWHGGGSATPFGLGGFGHPQAGCLRVAESSPGPKGVVRPPPWTKPSKKGVKHLNFFLKAWLRGMVGHLRVVEQPPGPKGVIQPPLDRLAEGRRTTPMPNGVAKPPPQHISSSSSSSSFGFFCFKINYVIGAFWGKKS